MLACSTFFSGLSSSESLVTWTPDPYMAFGLAPLDGGNQYLTYLPSSSLTVVRYGCNSDSEALSGGVNPSFSLYIMDAGSIPMFSEPTEICAYELEMTAGSFPYIPTEVFATATGCVILDSDNLPTPLPYSWGHVSTGWGGSNGGSLIIQSWAKP